MRHIARWRGVIAAAVCAVLPAGFATVVQEKGASGDAKAEAIYGERCAGCHDAGVSRAPARTAMAKMAVGDIREALTTGNMKEQGAGLTAAEIDGLAKLLGDANAASKNSGASGACLASAPPFTEAWTNPRWNGWGVDLTQRRFQPADMAQLTAEQVPKLKLKWAFGFPGVTQAYAQPAVLAGRVFVGSAGGKVYSLDAKTGCTYWTYNVQIPVRTAISVGENGGNWAVYFGDLKANAYAVDAVTGKLVWKTRVDEHIAAVITGAPALANGRVYVPTSSAEEFYGANGRYECCKFRGSLSALDAATGRVIWKSYTIADEPKPVRKNKNGVQLWGPSGAAVWSSPTVDLKRHMVYVTTGDNYSDPPAATSDSFMAFDWETGKLAWWKQMTQGDAYTVDCGMPAEMQSNCPQAKGPDFDFGSSAILVELPNGLSALVAGQKSGMVSAVDPDEQGKVIWQRRVATGGPAGGVQWGSAADSRNVYVAVSDIQMGTAPAGTPGARKSAFGIPLKLDPRAGGGLFALRLDTGEIAWHTPHPGCGDTPGCSPAQSAAVTEIPGVIFSGGVDGHLRAYLAQTGAIIWDVDTVREFATVNEVKANGGSMDGAGAVIAGGMLYVNSGYLFLGGAPGNVLLAFSVDGK